MMKYKGYTGRAEYDDEAEVFYGEVIGLRDIVTRMEIEHGQKLDALFDGYNMLYDLSREMRTDISELKANQNKHELMLNYYNGKVSAV